MLTVLRKVLGAMLTIGSAWQLYDCATAAMNGWPYAFPFRILVLSGVGIYYAMDFWTAMIIVAYLVGTYDWKPDKNSTSNRFQGSRAT